VYVHRKRSGEAARLIASVFLIPGIVGCGVLDAPSQLNNSDSTLGLSTSNPSDLPSYIENGSNDLLPLAEFVDLSEGAKLIQGRISSSDDVDVYDLGPV